jgi:uroporphyrinogen decarboxylase
MTRKENILAAIRREPAEQRAVALLSGGLWTLRNRGVSLEQALGLPAERFAAMLAASNERVGSGIIWTASGYHNLVVRALGGRIAFAADSTVEVVEPLSTRPPWHPDDLEADPGIAVLVDTTRHLERAVGNTTLVGSSQWAPFTLAGLLFGRERLASLLDTDKREAQAVLDFAADVCTRFLERFVTAGAELVSLADPDASGDLLPRRLFEEFVLPQLARVARDLREQGALVCVHICGDITDRLALLPELGVSFVSLDHKVDLVTARDVLRDRLAFSGNLDPVGIMRDASPQGVAAACRACLEKVGSTPGYILMPGCDLPADVPLANIQAMARESRAATQRGDF